MEKKDENVSEAVVLDIFEKQEQELVQDIIFALEASKPIVESVKLGDQLREKRKRLTNELSKLQMEKIELAESIEELKKDFGSEDSFADVSKLKKLSVELDAIKTAIPLLEKQVSSKSEVLRRISDIKEDVGKGVCESMEGVKKRLQAVVDEKTKDIVLTYSAFMKAFARAGVEQKMIPREFMSERFSSAFLPNSAELEKMVESSLIGEGLRENIAGAIFRAEKMEMMAEDSQREPQKTSNKPWHGAVQFCYPGESSQDI